MKLAVSKISILLATIPLLGVIGISQAQAEVTPAADGTGTVVTPSGNQLDITGGQTSSDGKNQFHSLTQFNVDAGKIANFEAANGNIRNILTRITGGNVSKINGEMKVTGGNNPNLFLINPAGFIFGNGATLNLPGSLTVTTANGIGFDSGWFSATGRNNYDGLTGNPTAFAFTMDKPGTIINSGDLRVNDGQNLTLIGGTVVNTGTLEATDGQINIAAVSGKNIVRISQQGSLLSLDVESTAGKTNLPNNWTLPIKSLPELLTGGDSTHVTGIEFQDGKVVLTGSGINVQEPEIPQPELPLEVELPVTPSVIISRPFVSPEQPLLQPPSQSGAPSVIISRPFVSPEIPQPEPQPKPQPQPKPKPPSQPEPQPVAPSVITSRPFVSPEQPPSQPVTPSTITPRTFAPTIVKQTEDNHNQEQGQEQLITPIFTVLSLDESLVTFLKNSGHATELRISNDGTRELKGSDFKIENEEFAAFNLDRNLLHSSYVFYQK